MTRVVVAAASSFAREGLEALLARDPGLEVVAAVSPGAALAVALDGGAPDVLLVEIGAESGATLAAALPRELFDHTPGPSSAPAVVLLAEAASAAAAADALRAGVRAVLRWDAAPDEILAAVHAAAAGLVAVPADLATGLVGPPGPARPAGPGRRAGDPDTPALTPRELEVLAMMAEGLGNKTIARRLGISDHTVKTHVAGLFARLGASTRTEAVALGVRRGLVVL